MFLNNYIRLFSELSYSNLNGDTNAKYPTLNRGQMCSTEDNSQ
jgi:hypothetical protein